MSHHLAQTAAAGKASSGDDILGDLVPKLPDPSTLLAAVLVILGLLTVNFLLRRVARVRRVHHDLIMIGLTLAGALAVIWTFDDSHRDAAFTIAGILVSAAIALSSGTLVGNGMAGLMLRAQRHFRSGDYLRVGDHFGRVSERGLFFTEVQNELRDLVTLPNSYLTSQPVTVVRRPSTLVCTEVSLGYDVPHVKVEHLLCDAAESAGLEEAFVHILALGDFSISYRVSGLLAPAKRLLTAKSKLNAAVLDTLHGAGVEIVSPAFMNQRQLGEGRSMIPPAESAESRLGKAGRMPEAVMFDKAEEAATRERLEDLVAAVDTKIEKLKAAAAEATEAEREDLLERQSRLESRRSWLVDLIAGDADSAGNERGLLE